MKPCENCGTNMYRKDFINNIYYCPKCGVKYQYTNKGVVRLENDKSTERIFDGGAYQSPLEMRRTYERGSCKGLIITEGGALAKEDTINHPSHYTDGKIETIDYIEDKKLNYHLGNAVKYISRAGKKDPDKYTEDLKKAVWYLNREIERVNR